MVQEAADGEISYTQAANTWDKTIHQRGLDNGVLTGYLKTQEGTSKRTAAGNSALQLEWFNTVTDVTQRVRQRAMEVLDGNVALVDALMPYLLINTDEENLSGTGKNERTVGSKRQKKHNNQNKSSRCQQIITLTFFFCQRNYWITSGYSSTPFFFINKNKENGQLQS